LLYSRRNGRGLLVLFELNDSGEVVSASE